MVYVYMCNCSIAHTNRKVYTFNVTNIRTQVPFCGSVLYEGANDDLRTVEKASLYDDNFLNKSEQLTIILIFYLFLELLRKPVYIYTPKRQGPPFASG